MADASNNLAPRSTSLAGRLWKLLFSIAMVVVAVAVANCFVPADRAISRGMFGHDFLAFYSAGKLIREGRAPELYDLDSLAAVQRQVADSAGLEVTGALAPYWNPPHVALLFSPITALPFASALELWTALGLLCLGLTSWMLSALVREATSQRAHWLLVPAALFLAPPTLQALGHGQNTPLSLLLLTLTVLAWRAREPIWAGLCCSLLFYKPQLAAIVFVALSLTLGWRVWIGMLVGGVPQLLLTVTRLPGSLSNFLDQVPRNLDLIQFAQPYLWHRHSTLAGFFRFVFQGNAPVQTLLWITALSTTCVLIVGVAVAWVWWRRRAELRDGLVSDRFIALVILAMPLMMPYYFDYDLLLLIVPAILIGLDRLECPDGSATSRWLTIAGCVLFAWTMFNPPIAEAFGVSLTVPLLCIVVALQARRCLMPIEGRAPITLSLRSEERLAA